MKLFLSYNGRINRATYWGLVTVLSVAWFFSYGALSALDISVDSLQTFSIGDLLVPVHFLFLFLVYIHFCVFSKRLHDIGQSAFLSLLFAIPVVGTIGVIVLGCLKGNVGENQYGPDPNLNI